MTLRKSIPVYDAVVIGGGIAGLTAAFELKKSGLSVMLLEANGYAGGRIHTVNYGDNYAEAGAMVVTKSEVESTSLMETFNVKDLIELGAQGVEMFIFGKRVKMQNFDGSLGHPQDLLGMIKIALSGLMSRGAMPRPSLSLLRGYRKAVKAIAAEADSIVFPYEPGARESWDTMTFKDYINRFHPDLGPYFDLQLKVTAGDDIDRISKFWGLVTFSWNAFDKFYWIRGGTSVLANAISGYLGNDMLLDARVTSVTQGERTAVEFEHDGIKERISGRTTVVATPAPAAKNMLRNLPEWKSEALDRVKYGAYIPVHLRCRSRFWERSIRTGYMYCEGTVFADLIDSTRGQEGAAGIITCFIAGREARDLLDVPDGQIYDRVVEDLERVFPGCRSEIESWRVFKWRNAIPYFPVDHDRALKDLRKPVGSIFFCGDYTQGAGINDAVVSGLVAARGAAERLAAISK